MSDGADIRTQFRQFVESGAERTGQYDRLRARIVRSDDYEPYSQQLNDIARLIDEARFDLAREQFESSLPNLLLSPRAHEMMAQVAAVEDDPELAAEESRAAMACLEAIAATGDGTREHPYRVLRASDEYDFLAYIRAIMVKQQVVHLDGKHYDVLQCNNGREIWFDITDAYQKLDDAMG